MNIGNQVDVKKRRRPTLTTYAVERSDTRKALDDPAGYWVDHVCANHGSLHFLFPDKAMFRAGSIVQRDGDYLLVDFWSEGLHYVKTAADVRADGDRGSMLFIARTGVIDIEQDGVQVRLQPGQALLLSKSRALRIHHRSWARGWTFDVADARRPTNMPRGPVAMDFRGGLGSVVSAMISTLSGQHETLDDYEFSRSCATISDLLSTCMLGRGGGPDTLGSVEQAVREHVARHASDPDLTPRSVAHSLGWSVRQIQLALQRAGTTTSDLIRSTRLTRAADLLRQSPSNTSIDSVAIACGFRSRSTFNTVFKKNFGHTPSEARAYGVLEEISDHRADLMLPATRN
ncbi:helix-turn-helix domain-containing protein [Mycobacterium montefiorense]|uniref:Transcriptional regulator n=2 Tax=Mycobacterium montefiorense TaxID=154654 RepID=A0AA37UWU8_9MYCO|nr:helix-turn-helix domain-containing protein [Mycobacterium montefiorense]MCV7427461.1 helix-turn-helix domain-containing protein [Mycobacterium montefiorense]GBG39585.1 transcriptional regulator [Mycobacterium montefiorense]GKU34706.1 transcriptional regulator [Mycobacterium montefiorense]GKU42428.1 transcriptional regulator [Mycobacterium montefiorense]GKU45993.1 transcriptional regulator [Mycobacterium montefiorense]